MCHSKLVLVTVMFAAVTAAPAALAQGDPPGTVTVSGAVTDIHQYAAALDHGGAVNWDSRTYRAGVKRQFAPAFAAGLSLRLDEEEWDVAPGGALGAIPPLQHLERPGVSVNLSLALSRTLVIGVSPTVDWARDSRAEWSDACTYGAVVSAVKVFSPTFVLGGGASVTRQFYDVKTSPFVIVDWNLTDRLRLANAIPSGPLGGAGVELRYALTPEWEVAGGGVWRSDRWLLGERDGRPGDVGVTRSIPLLARVSRKLGTHGRLDLHAGVATANELTLRDRDGHELAHEHHGVAPVLSATLSGSF